MRRNAGSVAAGGILVSFFSIAETVCFFPLLSLMRTRFCAGVVLRIKSSRAMYAKRLCKKFDPSRPSWARRRISLAASIAPI